MLQGVDGAGTALHSQPVIAPRGPTLGISRLGVLPSIADAPGAPQPLQNWVDRARLESTGAHDLQPVQLEVGTIEKCPQHRQDTHLHPQTRHRTQPNIASGLLSRDGASNHSNEGVQRTLRPP